MGATSQPVIFDTAVEGVKRTFGHRMTPELRARAREAGIDFERTMPAYPVQVFEEVVRLLARGLYPGVPEQEAIRRAGREFMQGYVETTLGKAALAVGKVVGPRRTMERMGRNFRTSGNYLRSETVVIGPSEVVIDTRIEDEFVPQLAGRRLVMADYRAGVIEGSLQLLGAKDVEVTIESLDVATQATKYRARWRE